MKTNYFNITKISNRIILAVILAGISFTGSARERKAMASVAKSISPSVEYMGGKGKETFLHISYTSLDTTKVELSVIDEFGNELYSQRFIGTGISKYVKLVNEGNDENYMNLKVCLKALPNGIKHSFVVASHMDKVKSTVVAKN